MIVIREAKKNDRVVFDKLARHPLQSWSWGEFRKDTGVGVSRLIQTKKGEPVEVFQITWHKIPKTGWCVGYCPKSSIPNAEAMREISRVAEKKRAIFVKFEPNEKDQEVSRGRITEAGTTCDLRPGKSLFTKYTFQLDIARSEEEILINMSQKTRYNVRLAEKKGVMVIEDNSNQAFEEYWQLTEETTKRQRFFAHEKSYHQKMWQTMIVDGGGHLMKAVYEGKTLTAWVLFELNGVLYYPYGASSNENREVMSSNLMMWEAIKLGKKHNCKMFDMWGSLGREPNKDDPWYGFHRFKQGFGGELVEFVGTYDLVIRPWLYEAYRAADNLRWQALRLIARLRS